MARLYIPPEHWSDQTIALDGKPARYLARVLRLGPGEELTIFDGVSRQAVATVEAIGSRDVRLRVGAIQTIIENNIFNITIVQAHLQGEKLDWLVEKLTEVGVTRFVFYRAKRSSADVAREPRLIRVAEAAARQSGRVRVPEIVSAPSLTAAIERLSQYAPPFAPALCLFGDTSELARSVNDALARSNAAAANVVVGPEGGLHPSEVDALRAAGFRGVRLGPRTLRAETAGLVFASILMHRLGDLA